MESGENGSSGEVGLGNPLTPSDPGHPDNLRGTQSKIAPGAGAYTGNEQFDPSDPGHPSNLRGPDSSPEGAVGMSKFDSSDLGQPDNLGGSESKIAPGAYTGNEEFIDPLDPGHPDNLRGPQSSSEGGLDPENTNDLHGNSGGSKTVSKQDYEIWDGLAYCLQMSETIINQELRERGFVPSLQDLKNENLC